MPLRIATYTDLSQIALILSKAFHNDPLNEYFFPNRDKYPDDYLRDYLHETTTSWWKYDRVWIVNDDNDDDGGVGVNGVICWARRGNADTPLWNVPGWWDPRRYISQVAIAYQDRKRRSFTNRAMASPSESDPEPIKKYDFGTVMAPFSGDFFSEPNLSPQHWEICVLAVHPDHQGRGIGADLVAWGVEKAKKENVPCIVIISTGKEAWYRKQGFEIYLGCAGTVDRVDEEGRVIEENPMKKRVKSGGHIYKTQVNV